MRIWIIKDLEPIPTDPGQRRLMRAGMLASTLARLGHETRWITSSFDHYQKRQREAASEIEIAPNYVITVLPGKGYSKNISLARVLHNRRFAREFERFASSAGERPDILITDVPTTETAESVVRFGRTHDIPTIVSIRDLWPEFFAAFFPAWMRPLVRAGLGAHERQVGFACRNTTSLVGISAGYLEWGRKKGRRAESADDCIIPLGYEPVPEATNEASAALMRHIGVESGARIVAFVGSWGHTYDLKLVFESAKRLVQHSDIRFVIAGNGEQSSHLLSKYADAPNVLMPGWLNAHQIAILLRRADIGLLPYSLGAPQGLPNKAFEYLAYGTYQLATPTGELADFYRQTNAGRVIPSRSADDFAAGILEAINSDAVRNGRLQRVACFNASYSANVVYSQLAAHAVTVARKHAAKARMTDSEDTEGPAASEAVQMDAASELSRLAGRASGVGGLRPSPIAVPEPGRCSRRA